MISFKVGPTGGAVATVIYAIPPMILMTILGLQKVLPEVVEAGKMSGCTRFQTLRHVYIPSARTEILVGVNQVIMFAFFMVIIAAFIGTQDLGQELQRTLAGTNLGANFVLGLCVSLMALSFDLIIMKWASIRKQQLGLET